MINIKKIKPLFTAIITTADCYKDDVKVGGIIDSTKQSGTMKEYQKVVAIGTSVRDIKIGDLVSINPTRFAVKKRSDNSLANDIEGGNPVLKYVFDQVIIDGKNHLMLQDRDIEFVIEDYEEIENEKSSPFIHPPKKDIIL